MRRLVVGLVVTLAGASGLDSHAANLVVNGTFDTTSGWSGPAFTLRYSGPTIDTRGYFFHGRGSSITVNQIYNLTGSELLDLDSIGLSYSMSADLFGYRYQRDNATFRSEFFMQAGGTGGPIESVDLQGLSPGFWPETLIAGTPPNYQSVSGLVPGGTQSIVFSVITSGNIDGARNDDGYADNLTFEIMPIPEPSTFALLAMGALVLLAYAWRRRRRRAV